MMFNLIKKSKIRNSVYGDIARWVGTQYQEQKTQNHSGSDKEIINKIFENRFQDGIQKDSIENLEGLFLGADISNANCLLDVVTTIMKYELGDEQQNDKKQMKLIYEVIIGELQYLNVPSGKIIPGLK